MIFRSFIPPRSTTWLIDFIFLTVIFSFLFFLFLGTRPLFVPDEGRYAEIIREMVVNQDWVTPYLNGIKYFEKPNLFYWLGSIAVHFFGLNLWSIRGVNAILSLLGCLLTYGVTRKLYDRKTALMASYILAMSALYFVMAHMISLDLTVTFFISASLFALLLSFTDPKTQRSKLVIFAVMAGLAVLTKGLIGLLFPLIIGTVWIFFYQGKNSLKQLYSPIWISIFLLIAAPWHIIVAWRNPEFSYYYFIEQHFLRYLTPHVGHYQPTWYFIFVIIGGFFPWIAFLPQTVYTFWQQRQKRIIDGFFFIWALVVFIFFSFSKSKLIPYILPIFPPLAILTTRYLIDDQQHLRGIKWGYFSLFLFTLIITCLFFYYPRHLPLPKPDMAIIFLSAAAIILLTGNSLALFFAFLARLPQAFIATTITTGLFLLTILAAIPTIDTRSILPLAEVLKTKIQPGDQVITYNQYYQDLPFYLERKVSILNWRNELAHGMHYQDTSSWMINDKKFWQQWYGNQRLFVIIGLEEYQQLQKNYPDAHPRVLAKTLKNVLITQEVNSLSPTFIKMSDYMKKNYWTKM